MTTTVLKIVNRTTAVVAVLFSICFAEVFCRLVLPPAGFEPRAAEYPPGLYEAHPVRGYSYSPGFETQIETTNFNVTIRTNSLGFRGDEPDPGFNGATVLALGDSLTTGWGVQFEQAWPAVLERRLRAASRLGHEVRVVAGAIPGYNMRQIRLLAEEFIPQFRPRLVIAGVYPYGYTRMHDPYILVDGQLFAESVVTTVRPVPGGFMRTLFESPVLIQSFRGLQENFSFGAYLLLAAHDGLDSAGIAIRNRMRRGDIPAEESTLMEAVFAEIMAIRGIAQKNNAAFALLLTTPQDAYGNFPGADHRADERTLRFAAEHGIAAYSPLSEMETAAQGQPVFRFPRDAHWNARAHELAAGGLNHFLVENGLAVDAAP